MIAVQVTGSANIGAQFKALFGIFKKVQPQVEKVELMPGEGGKGDTYQIKVLSRVNYYLPWIIR